MQEMVAGVIKEKTSVKTVAPWSVSEASDLIVKHGAERGPAPIMSAGTRFSFGASAASLPGIAGRRGELSGT